ncbi:MAG: hypothetical protein U5L74_00860 [Ideonella sp.]|nr:hypothetical protein [Ideonella sp.]
MAGFVLVIRRLILETLVTLILENVQRQVTSKQLKDTSVEIR